MPDSLPRPGVEVEQRFVTPSPTILVPSLPACIIGPAKYLVDAFNADGTLNTDAKINTQYTNASLTVLQSAFPDPRDISDNISVDEDTIRVFLVTGSTATEVLRTEAFLAPTPVQPRSGDAFDTGLGTQTTFFEFNTTDSGISVSAVKAGDRIYIDGIANTAAAVSIVSPTTPANTRVTLTTPISVTLAGVDYYIIATSDLTARLLTGFLTIGLSGEAIIAADFIRQTNGETASGAAADVYIQYEALRRDLSANPLTGTASLLTITDQDQLDAILGPVSTRNPLSVGVLMALINSPTASVNAIGVDETSTAAPEGTLSSYNRAMSFLEGKEVYALAPLTQDATIQQAFAAHVTALSVSTAKRERIVFINQVQPSTRPDKSKTTGNLANTIVRSLVLSNGFSVDAEENARMEIDMGTALVNATVVTAGDLVKAGKLRDADLYLQIAGGDQKFPIRTIVGFDVEIIDEVIASDSTTPTGINLGNGTVPSASTVTFTPAGLTVEDTGVREGDSFVVTVPVSQAGTYTVDTVSGNTVTITATFPNLSTITEYQFKLVAASGYTIGDFDDSAPGSPFANQQWAIRTIGEALVISGTNPPILDRTEIATELSIAANSFANRRVYFVQPDQVATTAITGVEEVVPGYYLAAAIAGMVGQQPPQQGFTNFPIAGFNRLVNSNDVYSDSQIAIAAGGGVYWVIQEAPGSAVIAQHQLSTDLTSIETRELSVTKNVDFVAKFLRAGLRRFIGRFNITPEFLDQLSTITQGLLGNLESRGILNGSDLNDLAVDPAQPDSITVDITLDVPLPDNFIRITLNV